MKKALWISLGLLIVALIVLRLLLPSIVKKKVNTVIKRSMTMLTFILLQKALDVPPSQFIIGAKKEGAEGGDDLDDDTQVCSCHVRLSLLPSFAFAIPVMCLMYLPCRTSPKVISCNA